MIQSMTCDTVTPKPAFGGVSPSIDSPLHFTLLMLSAVWLPCFRFGLPEPGLDLRAWLSSSAVCVDVTSLLYSGPSPIESRMQVFSFQARKVFSGCKPLDASPDQVACLWAHGLNICGHHSEVYGPRGLRSCEVCMMSVDLSMAKSPTSLSLIWRLFCPFMFFVELGLFTQIYT